MSRNRLMCAAIVAALASAPLVWADTLQEGFDGGPNPSRAKWTCKSTYKRKGSAAVEIRMFQADSALQFLGRGGGSACFSKVGIDWNDNFMASFQVSIDELDFVNVLDAARVGLAVTTDAAASFDLRQGCANGVQLEFRSDQFGTRIVLVSRKDGAIVEQSEITWIADGFHEVALYWYADPAQHSLSIHAYLDGQMASPVATLEGLPPAFIGADAKKATAVLFGGATGAGFMKASIDSFDFAGDFRNKGDRDDSNWGDPDNHNDEPVYSPVVSAIPLVYAMPALARSAEVLGHPVVPISLSCANGAISVLVRESSTQVRELRYDPWWDALNTTPARAATPAEQAAANMAVDPAATIPMQALLLSEFLADQSVQIMRCDLDAATQQWRLALANATSQSFTHVLPANGLEHGDGVNTTSFCRWIVALAETENANPGESVLSSRMQGGLCEFVLSGNLAPQFVRVVRCNPMTGALVSSTVRAPTAEELEAIPYAWAWKSGSAFTDLMAFMPSVAIQDTEFRVSAGAPLLRLRYIDAQGAVVVRDF
jgi:hypothetical protein